MKRIKIKYAKLGKIKAYGLADSDGAVYVDMRLKGKKHLEICLHESLHILFPELEEEDIIKYSIILCNTLWYERYRRTDNDNSQPMQDGSK